MKAFVFPGQGAQFVGMGKDLYDNNPLAKELFEKKFYFSGLKVIATVAVSSQVLRLARLT